jgi:hypothetical protein
MEQIATDMLHGRRPLQFGLWAEIWLLVGSLHKFLSVISSKSDLLGCKFRSLFRSLMGRNLVRTLNEAQSSGGAVSVSVIFSSTWRQLNLNFLVIGFSLRCEGSKTIDKPSPSILGLLRRGGGGVQISRCVKVHQWTTVGAAKPQLEHSGPKTPESGMEQKLRLSLEFTT